MGAPLLTMKFDADINDVSPGKRSGFLDEQSGTDFFLSRPQDLRSQTSLLGNIFPRAAGVRKPWMSLHFWCLQRFFYFPANVRRIPTRRLENFTLFYQVVKPNNPRRFTLEKKTARRCRRETLRFSNVTVKSFQSFKSSGTQRLKCICSPWS